MYGLLHSANRRLVHLPAAAAPYSELLLRAFSSTAGINDLVYVGKGHKICGKDEIEDQIRRINRKTIYQSKKRNKIRDNGRKVLPPKLQSRNVARLSCDSSAAGGICDVYLVGSTHNCPESWREVHNVISFLKPEVVFLELCSRRLFALNCHMKVPTMRGMLDLWKNNEDPFWILSMWFGAKCSNQQKCSEDAKWEGGEFRVSYEEAMKYGGKVILGDRPSHITNRRLLATMSPWKYLFNPIRFVRAEDLPEIVSKEFRTYEETIIMERDRYMSTKILEVAREHNSVVAVVGKGHLPGIQKYWKQPVDLKEILSIPAGNKIATMGKLLNTFAAMVTYLFLTPFQRNKISQIILDYYSVRLKMKNKS